MKESYSSTLLSQCSDSLLIYHVIQCSSVIENAVVTREDSNGKLLKQLPTTTLKTSMIPLKTVAINCASKVLCYLPVELLRKNSLKKLKKSYSETISCVGIPITLLILYFSITTFYENNSHFPYRIILRLIRVSFSLHNKSMKDRKIYPINEIVSNKQKFKGVGDSGVMFMRFVAFLDFISECRTGD